MSKGDDAFPSWYQQKKGQLPPLLHRYMTAAGAIATLLTRRLRFANPLAFNDPFDGQWDTLWQIRTKAFLAKRISFARTLLKCPPPSSSFLTAESRQRWELLVSLVAERGSRPLDDILAELLSTPVLHGPNLHRLSPHHTDLIRRCHVICFSEHSDSPLMWSHYAASHSGALLSFKTTALVEQWRRPIAPVTYAHHLPLTLDEDKWIEAEFFGAEYPVDGEFLAKAWAYTKAQCWAYEAEWRLFTVNSTLPHVATASVPFERTSLHSITLGFNMHLADRSQLVGIAADLFPTSSLMQARPSSESFSIEIDRCNQRPR